MRDILNKIKLLENILIEYYDYNNEVLMKRMNRDNSFGMYKDKIGEEGENWTDWLAEQDPTQNKKYVNWMITRYLKGGIQRLEDIPSKITPALTIYAKLAVKKKLNPEHRDINRFKNLDQFVDAVASYTETVASDVLSSKKEKKVSIEQEMYASGDAELVFNDKEYKIIIPHSHKASCYFGKNTKWCTTAADNDSYHNQYSAQGPMYIILHKPTNSRWQFHFESKQYMDEQDHQIQLGTFFEEHPTIFDVFQERDLLPPSFTIIRDIRKEGGVTKDNLNVLYDALRDEGVAPHNFQQMDKSSTDTRQDIMIEDFSDVADFANDKLNSDHPVHTLINIIEDPDMLGELTDFEPTDIPDDYYAKMIELLEPYYQDKIFQAAGNTDDPQRAFWRLEREGHRYYNLMIDSFEKAFKIGEGSQDEIIKNLKERAVKYIQYTAFNPSSLQVRIVNYDSEIQLIVSVDTLLDALEASGSDYDDEFEGRIYDIIMLGWGYQEEGYDYREMFGSYSSEQLINDEDGQDKYLETLTNQASVDMAKALDYFEREFKMTESKKTDKLLQDITRLSKI